MKRLWFLALLLAATLACTLIQPTPSATPPQSVETIVAATLQAWAANTQAPPPSPAPLTDGTVVSFENVRFILRTGVATNALAGKAPAFNDLDWPLQNKPEHIEFQLNGYRLYGAFRGEPYLLVIPAQAYVEVNQGAERSIARLQAILNGSAAPTAENLPFIPWFNATQLFAAQIQRIQFQSGSGIRFLTEYGQYFAPANNAELFYHFQGLTDDGKYYLIATLPISHPLLAPDDRPEAVVPEGGISFPGYDNPNNPDAINAYYKDIVSLLDQQTANSFTPSLADLDRLIESISVSP
jgi:hypothetical protein